MKTGLRIIILLFLLSHTTQSRAEIIPSSAPLNPAFEAYRAVAGNGPSAAVNPGGYLPSPVDYTYLKDLAGKRVGKQVMLALPASYDLRNLGRVTAVKNQNPGNTCWTFASLASLESNILSAAAETWDFSENNLKNTSGFDNGPDGGGNADMAAAYFARWSGPVTEKDDPYKWDSVASPAGLTVRKHLQEVLIIPPGDTATLKESIMQYGAATASLYFPQASSDYSSVNHALYYPGSATPNHLVALVGWDDNYSRANFVTAPPGDGAFIAKNSWGTAWGDKGYFYISYHDTVLSGNPSHLFNGAEAITNYGRVYQYDPLGKIGEFGYRSTSAWFANLFTAEGNELLTAVSFHAATADTTYMVKIYRGVSSTPVQGQPVSTISGTIPLPGYHTIPLATQVLLTAGEKFSIVVQITTPGWDYPVPIEYPVAGYSSAATASRGQSYVTNDNYGSPGAWYDLTTLTYVNPSYANANVCLKGFTQTALAANGLTISGPDSVNEKGTAAFSATATWSDGTTTAVTPVWSVTPATSAGISSAGTLTAPAVPADQSVTVTASFTAGGVTTTASKTVTIINVPLLAFLMITGPDSVYEGNSAAYSATATWDDGSTTSVTAVWQISSSSYASLSGDGLLTAKAVTGARSVTVTASYSAGGATRSATKSVTILDDTASPTLSIATPADGAVTNNVTLSVSGTAGDAGSGVASVTVNGAQATPDAGGAFSATVTLAAGQNTVAVAAVDRAGNRTAVTRSVILDTMPPELTLSAPADGAITRTATLTVSGTATDAGSGVATVTVNGAPVTPDAGGAFTATVILAVGQNNVTVATVDRAGNTASVRRTVTYTAVQAGDANGDTVVDVFDALLALQYSVGLYQPTDLTLFKTAADVAPLDAGGKPHGDGTVNVFDALAILRHAVGLDGW